MWPIHHPNSFKRDNNGVVGINSKKDGEKGKRQ